MCTRDFTSNWNSVSFPFFYGGGLVGGDGGGGCVGPGAGKGVVGGTGAGGGGVGCGFGNVGPGLGFGGSMAWTGSSELTARLAPTTPASNTADPRTLRCSRLRRLSESVSMICWTTTFGHRRLRDVFEHFAGHLMILRLHS